MAGGVDFSEKGTCRSARGDKIRGGGCGDHHLKGELAFIEKHGVALVLFFCRFIIPLAPLTSPGV